MRTPALQELPGCEPQTFPMSRMTRQRAQLRCRHGLSARTVRRWRTACLNENVKCDADRRANAILSATHISSAYRWRPRYCGRGRDRTGMGVTDPPETDSCAGYESLPAPQQMYASGAGVGSGHAPLTVRLIR
jgi:hypothetical protein